MNEHPRQEENKEIVKTLSLKVVLINALFIASLFTFAFIARTVMQGKEEVFDNKVFGFFASISTTDFIDAMRIFTFFGSVDFLAPAYIFLIGFYIVKKQNRLGIDIAIIGISSTALIFILKMIFQRQRPSLPIIRTFSTYSFPSGHMLSSFVFCSILVFIITKRKWKTVYKFLVSVLLFLFAITIGMSRIALKAHYPTDVIASFFLGIVWVILAFSILKKINREYLIDSKTLSAHTN